MQTSAGYGTLQSQQSMQTGAGYGTLQSQQSRQSGDKKLQTAATDCSGLINCICLGPDVRNVVGYCTIPYPRSDF